MQLELFLLGLESDFNVKLYSTSSSKHPIPLKVWANLLIIWSIECVPLLGLSLLILFNWSWSKSLIASEESFLLSHMGHQKNAIKSLILVVEQFCMKHFLIFFQFWIDSKHEPARPGQDASVTNWSRFSEAYFSVPEKDMSFCS